MHGEMGVWYPSKPLHLVTNPAHDLPPSLVHLVLLPFHLISYPIPVIGSLLEPFDSSTRLIPIQIDKTPGSIHWLPQNLILQF